MSRIMRVYFSNPVAHTLRTNKVSLQSVCGELQPWSKRLGILEEIRREDALNSFSSS